MGCRLAMACAVATLLALDAAPTRAFERGDDQFPNSIMAPERGMTGHYRDRVTKGRGVSHADTQRAVNAQYRKMIARGIIPPGGLPRTSLMPPVGVTTPALRSAPQAQGPIIVPSAPQLGPIPSLPHGPETFQDRASRCAFQQGLYGVPGSAGSQYMGACVQ
jgi:hypothetical protein